MFSNNKNDIGEHIVVANTAGI